MTTTDTKPAPELARTRKRFVRRQWARRWLAWRRLLIAAVVLLLVGGAVYAVYFSSLLEVEGLEVRGTSALSESEVAAAAEAPLGDPLATVDLAAIERRVGSMGAVRSVEVSRQWPHEVLVVVEERVPVAVVRTGDLLRNLDADGVVFGDRKRPPGNLPTVETSEETTQDALREAATVAGALDAAFLATVDHLEVRTVDQITLVLRDGRLVRWGNAAQSAEKARVLTALLSREAAVYDVSVPGAPTTGPR